MIEERVSLLTTYLHYDVNYVVIVGDFQHRFPNLPAPMWQVIHRLNKKFQRTGSVMDLKCVIEEECDVFREQPEFFHKSCLTVRNSCKRCID